MEDGGFLDRFSKETLDFLSEPIESELLVPKAEQLIESLEKAWKAMPTLERYRQVRERMGSKSDDYIIPPNFSYRLHTS